MAEQRYEVTLRAVETRVERIRAASAEDAVRVALEKGKGAMRVHWEAEHVGLLGGAPVAVMGLCDLCQGPVVGGTAFDDEKEGVLVCATCVSEREVLRG